jgi:hypothetical protein
MYFRKIIAVIITLSFSTQILAYQYKYPNNSDYTLAFPSLFKSCETQIIKTEINNYLQSHQQISQQDKTLLNDVLKILEELIQVLVNAVQYDIEDNEKDKIRQDLTRIEFERILETIRQQGKSKGKHKRPNCFISYTYESDVFSFLKQKLMPDLHKAGIRERIDYLDLERGKSVQKFQENMVMQSDYVCVIQTPLLKEKAGQNTNISIEMNHLKKRLAEDDKSREKVFVIICKGQRKNILPQASQRLVNNTSNEVIGNMTMPKFFEFLEDKMSSKILLSESGIKFDIAYYHEIIRIIARMYGIDLRNLEGSISKLDGVQKQEIKDEDIKKVLKWRIAKFTHSDNKILEKFDNAKRINGKIVGNVYQIKMDGQLIYITKDNQTLEFDARNQLISINGYSGRGGLSGKILDNNKSKQENDAQLLLSLLNKEQIVIRKDEFFKPILGEIFGYNITSLESPIKDREKELQKIKDRLTTDRKDCIKDDNIWKTRLTAVQYINAFRKTYRNILWINAENVDTIRESLLDIARKLEIDNVDTETKTSNLFEQIEKKIRGSNNLIVFDNAKEETEIYSRYFESDSDVLVTTKETLSHLPKTLFDIHSIQDAEKEDLIKLTIPKEFLNKINSKDVLSQDKISIDDLKNFPYYQKSIQTLVDCSIIKENEKGSYTFIDPNYQKKIDSMISQIEQPYKQLLNDEIEGDKCFEKAMKQSGRQQTMSLDRAEYYYLKIAKMIHKKIMNEYSEYSEKETFARVCDKIGRIILKRLELRPHNPNHKFYFALIFFMFAKQTREKINAELFDTYKNIADYFITIKEKKHFNTGHKAKIYLNKVKEIASEKEKKQLSSLEKRYKSIMKKGKMTTKQPDKFKVDNEKKYSDEEIQEILEKRHLNLHTGKKREKRKRKLDLPKFTSSDIDIDKIKKKLEDKSDVSIYIINKLEEKGKKLETASETDLVDILNAIAREKDLYQHLLPGLNNLPKEIKRVREFNMGLLVSSLYSTNVVSRSLDNSHTSESPIIDLQSINSLQEIFSTQEEKEKKKISSEEERYISKIAKLQSLDYQKLLKIMSFKKLIMEDRLFKRFIEKLKEHIKNKKSIGTIKSIDINIFLALYKSYLFVIDEIVKFDNNIQLKIFRRVDELFIDIYNEDVSFETNKKIFEAV